MSTWRKKLAIKEKQMKTTLIYYFETTKMRLLNQKTITGVGENVKKLEPSLSYENRK